MAHKQVTEEVETDAERKEADTEIENISNSQTGSEPAKKFKLQNAPKQPMAREEGGSTEQKREPDEKTQAEQPEKGAVRKKEGDQSDIPERIKQIWKMISRQNRELSTRKRKATR